MVLFAAFLAFHGVCCAAMACFAFRWRRHPDLAGIVWKDLTIACRLAGGTGVAISLISIVGLSRVILPMLVSRGMGPLIVFGLLLVLAPALPALGWSADLRRSGGLMAALAIVSGLLLGSASVLGFLAAR